MQMCARRQVPGENVTCIHEKLYLLKCLNLDWPTPVAKSTSSMTWPTYYILQSWRGSHHICASMTLFTSLQHCTAVQPERHQNLSYRHRCRPWRSLVALVLNRAIFSGKRRQAARIFPSSLTTEPSIPILRTKTITSGWFPS